MPKRIVPAATRPRHIVPGALFVLAALLSGGLSAGAQQAASAPPPLTPTAAAPVVVQISPAQVAPEQVAAAPLGEDVAFSPPYTVVNLPLPPSRRQFEQTRRRVAAAKKRRDVAPATPYPPYHVVQAAPVRRAAPVWITVGNGF